MPGPAPGRWASPTMAVPISTKIPVPIIAPIPSAVRSQTVKVFFSRCSGRLESARICSMDFKRKMEANRFDIHTPSTGPIMHTKYSSVFRLSGPRQVVRVLRGPSLTGNLVDRVRSASQKATELSNQHPVWAALRKA